jgi:putative transposase
VIHHSDQGGEYSSHDLARQLRTAGILPSMGSVADGYDNALAESFFATAECELSETDRMPAAGRVNTPAAA